MVFPWGGLAIILFGECLWRVSEWNSWVGEHGRGSWNELQSTQFTTFNLPKAKSQIGPNRTWPQSMPYPSMALMVAYEASHLSSYEIHLNFSESGISWRFRTSASASSKTGITWKLQSERTKGKIVQTMLPQCAQPKLHTHPRQWRFHFCGFWQNDNRPQRAFMLLSRSIQTAYCLAWMVFLIATTSINAC